jgi:poly(A) polymerase
VREAAEQVIERLRSAGFEAYLVGGCVRDLLLQRAPKDWDVATSATPAQAAPLFDTVREVGRHFGVLRVRSGAEWIEVATYRAEGTYTDGRHPDAVRFTDAREDALRRDFTVNALLLDPQTNAVLDFVGGQADLRAKLIRAVGDPTARFTEDALRLLRAVRFACRLGFTIEPATWSALQHEAARIRGTSAERVRDELLAVLTGPMPRRGLELLQESGLLPHILPEIAALRGVQQGARHHPEGDVWEHTLRMFEHAEHPSPMLALGILLHDVGKPSTRTEADGEVRFYGHVEAGCTIAARVLERLRIPNRIAAGVLELVGQHMRFLDAGRMKKSTLRRFVLQENFGELLELHRLDALGSRGDLTSWERVRAEQAALAREVPPTRPLLSGHDLQALGHAPGPRLGEILAGLVDAQLEGEVVDRDAARLWVERHYPVPGSPSSPDTPGDFPPGRHGTARA